MAQVALKFDVRLYIYTLIFIYLALSVRAYAGDCVSIVGELGGEVERAGTFETQPSHDPMNHQTDWINARKKLNQILKNSGDHWTQVDRDNQGYKYAAIIGKPVAGLVKNLTSTHPWNLTFKSFAGMLEAYLPYNKIRNPPPTTQAWEITSNYFIVRRGRQLIYVHESILDSLYVLDGAVAENVPNYEK